MDLATGGVYQSEMKRVRDFNSVEIDHLFSGKAPAEDGDLSSVARFVSSTRSAYLTQIDPQLEDSHLASLMKVVDLTDKGDLAARPASKATGPDSQVSGLPMRRRTPMLETLFAGLVQKIAAAVVAVLMTATGGLAATGNLPDDMQKAISEALSEVGIEVPDGNTTDDVTEAIEDTTEEAVEDVEDTVEDGEEVVDEVIDETEGDGTDEGDGDGSNQPGSKATPNPNASFGQRVAADARDGGVDGQQISEEARQRNEARRAAREETPTDGTTDGGSDDTDSVTKGLDRVKDTPAGGQVGGPQGGRPAGAGRP